MSAALRIKEFFTAAAGALHRPVQRVLMRCCARNRTNCVHMHYNARMSPAKNAPSAVAARGCTCARLRSLSRRITAVYNRALAPSGMRVTQYSLLVSLRRSGPTSMSRLAESMDMDRTTLTRNLRPLLAAGWLRMQSDPDDARVRRVVLTAKGEAHLAEARGCWRRAQDEVASIIDAQDLGRLHQLIDHYIPLFRPAADGAGENE